LPKHITDRVSPERLCALNKRLTETNLLDLFWLNAVAGDMLDAIFRPDELVNLHSWIPYPA